MGNLHIHMHLQRASDRGERASEQVSVHGVDVKRAHVYRAISLQVAMANCLRLVVAVVVVFGSLLALCF